jgi:MFS family permease
LLLTGFVLVERRLREPLIDLAMLARRNVSGASVVIFVLNFAFGAVLFFLPLYLEEQLAFDALKAGLLMLPLSAPLVVAMPLGGRLFERFGPIPPIVAGMALAGLAVLLLGNVSTTTNYAELWPALALLGLGIGTALTPLNLAALNATPTRNHGTVAAILAMLAGLGGMFGVAISGALFEQLQTGDTVSAAADRGVQITDSAARTLDGLMAGTPDAMHAIAHYPAAQHAALTAAVHEGFVSAFAGAMELSLGLVIAGIVITLVLIRSQDETVALPVPNVTQPFSGLSPRP